MSRRVFSVELDTDERSGQKTLTVRTFEPMVEDKSAAIVFNLNDRLPPIQLAYLLEDLARRLRKM